MNDVFPMNPQTGIRTHSWYGTFVTMIEVIPRAEIWRKTAPISLISIDPGDVKFTSYDSSSLTKFSASSSKWPQIIANGINLNEGPITGGYEFTQHRPRLCQRLRPPQAKLYSHLDSQLVKRDISPEQLAALLSQVVDELSQEELKRKKRKDEQIDEKAQALNSAEGMYNIFKQQDDEGWATAAFMRVIHKERELQKELA